MARVATCLLWMASLALLHASLAGCQAPASPSSHLASGTAIVAPPNTTVVLPDGLGSTRPAILESLTQAQGLVSYTLLEPDPETLPPDMPIKQVEWWPRDERGIEAVTVPYEGGGHDLSIMQVGSPFVTAALAEPHESLVVRGQKGYLVSSGSAHAFVWEEKQGAIHVAITVSSGNQSLDELLRIAEGLRACRSEL